MINIASIIVPYFDKKGENLVVNLRFYQINAENLANYP